MEEGPNLPVRLWRSLPSWAMAAALGALADRAGIPLAWVLGPLVAAAGFAIAGRQPFAPVKARRGGQLIVGCAVGLNLTPDAALKLVVWLPGMIFTAVLSIFLAALLSIAVARLGRMDIHTAYFAMLPGGLSEMANVGSKFGAQSEAVSLSHALRVALAVLIVPPLVLLIDDRIDLASGAIRATLEWPALLMLGGAAAIGAMALRLVNFANPWMLGALAAGGLLAGTGMIEGRLPSPLLWAGQFFIGLAIGSRFRGSVLRRLPRFGFVSSIGTLLLGLLMAGYAWFLRMAGASDFESLILAVSPGGFAEMTLTAQALHLDVALVTGFHFVRAFAVNSLAAPAWVRLERLPLFSNRMSDGDR